MTDLEQWDWEWHERQQRAAWRTTTPAQRLSWLEDALRFAADAGALPARPVSIPDEGPEAEG